MKRLPLLLLILASFAHADDSPSTQPVDKGGFALFKPVPRDALRDMDTDRPNVANTPHTIDAGHVQLEAGLVDYDYDRDRSHPADTRSDAWGFGELNARIGVLNHLEVNVAINAYESAVSHDFIERSTVRTRGLGDTVIGGKLNLWGDEGGDAVWASGLAIQPQFKFATATRGLGNGHFETAVNLPFVVNMPAAVHLSLQPTVSSVRSAANSGYVTGYQGAVAVDREFFKKLDLYAEYVAAATTERHQKTPQQLDLGGIYQLTDNLSLDTGFNLGLNRAADSFEWVAGISVRF